MMTNNRVTVKQTIRGTELSKFLKVYFQLKH